MCIMYLSYNRIPITQYHTNSVYSRSAIISVIALLLTNQLPITLYCTPTSANERNPPSYVVLPQRAPLSIHGVVEGRVFCSLSSSLLRQIHGERAHKLFAFVSSSGSSETLLSLAIAPPMPCLSPASSTRGSSLKLHTINL